MSVYFVTSRFLACDAVTDSGSRCCPARFYGEDEAPATKVRAAAKRADWAYLPEPTGRDYCPEHKPGASPVSPVEQGDPT